jgi:hypothetical protein
MVIWRPQFVQACHICLEISVLSKLRCHTLQSSVGMQWAREGNSLQYRFGVMHTDNKVTFVPYRMLLSWPE